ncbi:hypothetical protein DFQ27_007703 [Actinomortierella ambigua]|uniref:Thiamine-binding protein domain-containing protein n=1 Tax=Actinomortierella ambigua TaxID=1343610 RepID=A0A9P6PVP3_9FUNG|nr:hypothetical protein DFQ27_007703 [Actinomortierella ambigua]
MSTQQDTVHSAQAKPGEAHTGAGATCEVPKHKDDHEHDHDRKHECEHEHEHEHQHQHQHQHQHDHGEVKGTTSSSSSLSSSSPSGIHCRVDFAIYPGKDCQSSLSECMNEIEKVLAQHGFTYVIHSHGTSLEGPMPRVLRALEACHAVIHDKCSCMRLYSNVRMETRTDKVLRGTSEKKEA